ncbi:TonB-dependent hemoglobin/transferrin/lactoferrin family receptor [Enterovibrio makurazakiensis]|uniref:TonB-dependent hemoglobin/transferrin/lactoferrin family receptor n=1 Tax=Enterovibrio gelatinilyticus TaxID=2899819 RepID=A0ABT5QWY7_9GAMM|nr:TonB-dependent hemoglobin/transferrin/lactoferrin family receptor [Enterovibrio sp. ZSDZ42]MDD1792254.1 TonB-dependent hemoglobin/transferrin/lactoferrin family receptor [Enterovibrio sp. ZSDZ42]
MTIKKNKLALLVGLLCAGSAAAQDVYTFDEVVVSATRSEQSISDVAVSVDVVDSKKIEENLAQDLEQAVANEPGVSMPGTGRFGNSGFNIRGLSENYVKTMVDGVEQPVSFDPGADVMRKYNNNVETDTLQRIEINKGPSSSLYGSDALAGAVIIRTKNPEDLLVPEGDDTYASVKTGYYSADESYKATATIANRTGDLDTLLIFTHRDGHETKTHSSGSDIEGRERGQADPFDINSDNLLLKAFYQINDDHRVGLTGEIFNREADGLISSNEGYEIMPGFVYTRNSANDEDKRRRVTFEHDWQANTTAFDRLKWQVTALESESLHNTFDETPEPPTSFGHGYRQRVRNGEDKSTQFDAQFDKAFDLATSYHEISYGVNYITNEFNLDYRDMYLEGSKAGTQADKAGDVPNAESVKWGIFVQDQAFLLEERLVLNAGLRYDSFSAEPKGTTEYANSESDAVTAKLGAVYHWTERLSSYANVSQGFKSPTLQDLYYFYETDAAYGAVYEANPDLKPEESVGYETGLRITQDFGRFDFAVYYNDYKNFIESTKLADNNGEGKELWSKQNISKAEIYGAEFKAQLALDVLLNAPTGMYSDFSVAYTKGKDKENGEALDTVSPLSAYFALGYANVEGTYGGKVAVKAVAGKSDSDWSNANIDTDNVSAPGYAVTDITAYYRPVSDLTVRAGLFNAFDKKYWEYTDLIGAESDTEGLDRRTQSGRNWGIEAEYVF